MLAEKYRITFVVLIISGFSILSIAQDPMVTDRPDQTESASIVPKNYFQLESGFLSVTGLSNFSFSNLFRYGIHKNLELRMVNTINNTGEFDFGSLYTIGLNDLELGAKIGLLTGSTQIAILSHLSLPIGSEEHSLGVIGLNSRLCISHVLTESIGLAYNLGYFYADENSSNAFATVSFAISLTEKVGYYLEAYGNYSNDSELSLNMDTGITYLYRPNLQFDLSFGYEELLNGGFVSWGLSWRSPN